MFFREEYKTVIEDFGKDGRLSLLGVLRIFENLGNRHSDLAGDSVFKYDGSSAAWVLTEWKIETEEYPLYNDSIEIETWSEEPVSPLVATRNFLLYKNGSPCIRGTTRWVLFDIKTQRLCKIGKELVEKYQPENRTVFNEARLEKIPLPQSFESEKKIEIRKSDFDFNGHVHNLTYLDYALESLPDAVYSSQQFKKLRITYKSAVTEGNFVCGKYAGVDEKKIVVITDSENNAKAMVMFE